MFLTNLNYHSCHLECSIHDQNQDVSIRHGKVLKVIGVECDFLRQHRQNVLPSSSEISVTIGSSSEL